MTSKSSAASGSEAEPQNAETTKQPPADPPRDPVKRFTWLVFGLIVLLALWYLFADRYAPWTDQARVQAWVVPIAPKVSGKVVKVNVVQDQVVEPGGLLVEIDPREYELAVARAEAELEIAVQNMGASAEQITVAEASLSEARTQLALVEAQAGRYLALAEKGTVSKAETDSARAEVAKAESRVASAIAELEQAKDQLGTDGNDNAAVRSALAALETARIDLAETRIFAPTGGGITNLNIQKGYYANAGSPIMTFVSDQDVWIQANFRENSLAHIDPGDPVEIVLDMAPGRIFKGRVFSRGFAIATGNDAAAGQAAHVEGKTGWLRDAQRFPVIINFDDDSAWGLRLVGGQADVQVYTGDHSILNALGWLWIRLMSGLSFVY